MLEPVWKSSGPRGRARLGWALAPVLAGLAVLVQYVADVPKGEMLLREEKKDSAKTAATERPKPGAKSKPARRPGKSYVARDDAERRALRGRWTERPIEEEPIDQKFRRHHETLLRALVTRVRAELLGARKPSPMQVRPSCHTIRCSLEVCTDREILAGIAEELDGINVGDRPLWHELREVEATREPAKREAMKDHACRRWVVDFAVEGATIGDLTIDIGTLHSTD